MDGMGACHFEMDLLTRKAQRAAARRRNLSHKHLEYARSRLACSQPPARASDLARQAESARVKLHGILRAAARTSLAKGILESAADVPLLVSVGRAGRRAFAPRKPAAARVLTYARSEDVPAEPACCSQEYFDRLRCSCGVVAALAEGCCPGLDLLDAEAAVAEAPDRDTTVGAELEEEEGRASSIGSPAMLSGPEDEPAQEGDAGWELLPPGVHEVEADSLGWSLVA